MSGEHERFREQLGAYLLGELDGEDLRLLRKHLDACSVCQAEARELGPVVAALAEAAPHEVEEAPEPPADLEERTFARISQAREKDQSGGRLRWLRRRPALAAAALLAVVAAGLVLYPRLFAPEVPIEPVSFSEKAPGVEADAGMISHSWGTETRLVASGLKDGQTYTVTLLDEKGNSVPSGTFIGSSRPVECNLNAALLRKNAAGFEVRGAGDELMLYANLPDRARVPYSGGILSWIAPSLWGSKAGSDEPETVKVPDVRGLVMDDAEGTLRKAGFRAEISRRESRPEDDGKVLDQSPPGGEELIGGARIVLTVGEAPREARREPGGPPDPAKTNAAGTPAPSVSRKAEAPPATPPPGTESDNEATPPAPAPAPVPAEPAPPADEQAPGPYDQPAQEQYSGPSYDRQPEQPYPGGNNNYSENPGYANGGSGTDGVYRAPGYGGGANDSGRGSYGSPDSGSDSGSGSGTDRGGGSGYGGSGY